MLKAIDVAVLGAHHRYIQVGAAQVAFALDGLVRRLLLLLGFLALFRLHFFGGRYASSLKNGRINK